jgi:hypothetical protein
MIGPLQGFAEAEGDYRHAQLMALAGQCIAPRKSSNHRIHNLISKSRRRHARRA